MTGLFLAAALAGLAAGAVHAATGPDHLAVVASLASRDRSEAWRVGVRWGVGHAMGVAVVGAAALLLREALPLEILETWSERLVGGSLVAVGVWVLAAALRDRHAPALAGAAAESPATEQGHQLESPVGHAHTHGPVQGGSHGHRHSHSHDDGMTDRAALAVGVLHGTGGGSHLVGILPALALSSGLAAGAYVLCFAGGTIGAMGAFSWLVGWGGSRTARLGPGLRSGFMGACAAVSIVVGLLWLVP